MPLVSVQESEICVYYHTHKSRHAIPTAYSIDLSSLRDPMGRKELRKLDGSSMEVQNFLAEDSRVGPIIRTVHSLAHDILRVQASKYMSVTFHDHHGKWISQGVARMVGDYLSERGFKVCVINGIDLSEASPES